ncbi:exosome component 3 [Capsaspora owczarzaki ATCC 30864]|uniref:Ribosomal RNA-processing protein 40 n=1 Tax=Capsaspora owczarzaki (strain ATCC 30864) TaxID=595528 RepID=A0A0D2UQG3_CAPO3|nr:exosome component 3 [Capsaspora owczarzaki ATCC 30864]KJE97241.1 exosome component 3 [Capsaspora owczarzaki ATCC 30864]|eukprot:XP_004343556.1 exosome component 3 [Capsaspora owczarzaki ATCC 30864]
MATIDELFPRIGSVVLPGDALGDLEAGDSADPADGPGSTTSNSSLHAFTQHGGRLRLGPGLAQEGGRVIAASRAGVLQGSMGAASTGTGANAHSSQVARLYIASSQKRYVPAKDELVVGIITDRMGEAFKVDIGAAASASLSFLAFEGATKRNRPNLAIGALVYGKLAVANKDMEPEMVCIDAADKAAGMGELTGGYLIHISSGLTRRLLSRDPAVLIALGKHFALETAIGLNGRTWINAQTPQQVVLIANAIQNSEFMTVAQINAMVQRLVQAL